MASLIQIRAAEDVRNHLLNAGNTAFYQQNVSKTPDAKG